MRLLNIVNVIFLRIKTNETVSFCIPVAIIFTIGVLCSLKSIGTSYTYKVKFHDSLFICTILFISLFLFFPVSIIFLVVKFLK